MVKYINYFFALFWLFMFVILLLGYKPSNIEIGCSFLLSIFSFLQLAKD